MLISPPARRRLTTLLGFLLTVIAPTVIHAQDAEMPVDHSMHHGHLMEVSDPATWRMPPMPPEMPMPPGLDGVDPVATAFLPGMGIDPSTIPQAHFRTVEQLADGDTLHLEAGLVRRTLKGKEVIMYGFNGQYPGPLIRTEQGATVVIDFHNGIDLPTTVHWHGVRLDNRFDGVPDVTQAPVEPGGSFVYRVRFPDAGIYWYHPHIREDITQEMGLYGNMLIDPIAADHYSPVNREEVLMLDDILMDDSGLFPLGGETATQTLMGRFGTVMLVNGEPNYRLEVARGEVVRYYLTNASNTRIFNVTFGGAPIKVVGSDVGLFEKEVTVESVVLAPAERYIVEVRYPEAGSFPLANQIQAINHFRGEFYDHVDTLGTVAVSRQAAEPDFGSEFATLRHNAAVTEEINPIRAAFDRAPDYTISLDVEIGALPLPLLQMIEVDTLYFPPIEWNDVMPEMNYYATGENVRWILRDEATGRENLDIAWKFKVGDVVKIRVFNDPTTMHPMQHPIHLHGQRFLVVSKDGVANPHLAWKDTALVPLGSTVDLLVEMSNPGTWMIHCHIAEHLESGMHASFEVLE